MRLNRVLMGLCLPALMLANFRTFAAEPIALRAGPLSMVFDVERAFLRYVKVGGHEVLQGVNAPIRDQTWGTVRPDVTNLKLDNQVDHFTLTFDVACKEREIDFRWRGTISGTRSGEVEFTFDGVAHSTFLRNRIGLCVLHGPLASGKPWIIKHVGGQESKGAFPGLISPHQPAKQIKSIAHEVAKDVWAHVELSGETFEMEDQRNWTDASFKTYCTPLEIPFPVRVEKGTKISHNMRLRIEGKIPETPSKDSPIVVALGKKESQLPRIGLQVSSETNELTERQLQRLKELRLDHLRVDLRPANAEFTNKLRFANRQASALRVPLHIGVQLDKQPETELQDVERELKAVAPNASIYLIGVTDWRQMKLAREALKDVRGKATLLGGFKGTNFVDLNRDRPPVEDIDVVAYPINPQIHAFDDASIVETLPIHADTVRSSREFVGKRPLVIGPITLRPQFIGGMPKAGMTPPDVDVRQPTAFTAAWTLGSINYLAAEEVHSATFFETVGWKGVMERDDRPAVRPAEFRSTPSSVFAVYHLLRDVGEFAGGRMLQLDSSDPLSVIGLALKKPGQLRLLVANMTGRQQSVVLRGLDSPAKVSQLVADSSDDATNKPDRKADPPAEKKVNSELPLLLPPHAIIRLDCLKD